MTKNMAASVRQRLLNRSRDTGERFNNLLIRYGIERLLYRIAVSEHAEAFVLKGANLFYAWTGELHRPTKDLDMLRFGSTEPQLLIYIITSCVTAPVEADDGLVFHVDTIEARPIREDEIYGGVRITLLAMLGTARISLQLDVGTGDAVTPAAEWIEYPSLLDMPAPQLRAYRLETAIAEKCEAMVKLGMVNTRMKDFYDVYVLARDFEFEGAVAVLAHALRDTFARRQTEIPDKTPVAWTEAFSGDPQKQKQWGAFLRKSGLESEALEEVVERIRQFLEPMCEAARHNWEVVGQWDGHEWRKTQLSSK